MAGGIVVSKGNHRIGYSVGRVYSMLEEERGVVTIGMNYSVRAGKEEVFEAACRRVMETMAEDSGHAESKIYRSIEPDSREYLIVSRWSSEQAFRSFIGSEAFRKVTDWGAANILEGRPSHTTYRED